jgi:hypothetical protein
MTEDLIPPKTAAIQAEVHSNSIYTEIKRGHLRATRKAGRVMIEKSSF